MWFVLFVLMDPVVLGIIGFAVVLAIRSRRSAARPSRSVFLRRVAVVGSVVVLVPFVIIRALPLLDTARRHLAPSLPIDLWNAPDYRWWTFPLPVLTATVVLLVVLAHLTRGVTPPEQPVSPVARRTWLTFTRRRDIVIAAVAVGTLMLISVLAGLASATDKHGLHTLIRIPGGDLGLPGGDPAVPPSQTAGFAGFYGWAYSVPVMVSLLALIAVAYLTLRVGSIRPFRRPETVQAETAERRQTAATVLWLFIPAVLLPLGGALDQIGGAGLGSTGVGIPGVGTFMWSVGYSAFAPAIVAAGSLLEAAAVALLLLGVTWRPFRELRPAAPLAPAAS